MGEFDNILYEVENGRARITLNRPEKLNAMTLALQAELNEALWEADNNNDVHCVILKGNGRAFCSGYDLGGGGGPVPVSRIQSDENSYRGGRSVDDDAWQMERAQRYRMALFDMHKPSIAQVHGYCLAGGTDVALMCDMVIAAEDAVFGFPPARDLGALPNNMWLYHVGPQWAKRLMLTGDSVTGAEAQQIGLVLKAVPKDLLEQEVEQLADRLALIDPICSRRTNASSTPGSSSWARALCSEWQSKTTSAGTTRRRPSRGASACARKDCARLSESAMRNSAMVVRG